VKLNRALKNDKADRAQVLIERPAAGVVEAANAIPRPGSKASMCSQLSVA